MKYPSLLQSIICLGLEWRGGIHLGFTQLELKIRKINDEELLNFKKGKG